MDEKGTGTSSAHGLRPEHHERENNAFVRFWTDSRDATRTFVHNATLAAIVENGQGINTHLTLSDNGRRTVAINMVTNDEINNTTELKPSSRYNQNKTTAAPNGSGHIGLL